MSQSLSLFPHQRVGVDYLKSSPKHALLFDEQRVGKTPQLIVASGELGLEKVLVVTTVGGVGVWRHQWKQWDRWGRKPAIVPWSQIVSGRYNRELAQTYNLTILDESHYAKAFTAQRTRRAFGTLIGRDINQAAALVAKAERVWCATGTPMTHDPGDLFPVLKALFPEILIAHEGMPDVSTFTAFRNRYCVMVQKRFNRRVITVVVRGQNLDELQRRLRGRFLRRRQKDVGIRPAFWDTMPFPMDDADRADLEQQIDDAHINSNAMTEESLAKVRRITGTFKAPAVVDAAKDYLEHNPDKLVIAYWHKDVGDVLENGLAKFNPVRVDGSVTGDERTRRVARFGEAQHRVFLAQIAACSEAIDLSAASELWFAESVFTPSLMAQMGARITNLNQPKQCLVRVAALEESIDEVIQDRLVDLSRSIAHTLGEHYHENFRTA